MTGPRFGQVLCCGMVPKIGYHNFHEYDGQKGLRAYGCYCPRCGKHSSIIGEYVDFAIHHFNRKAEKDIRGNQQLDGRIPAPLNAPAGYRWGSVYVNSVFMGGKESVESDFILFHTVREDLVGILRGRQYVIDEERQLVNLKLMNSVGVLEDLDWFVTARNCGAYVNVSSSSDGTAWYNLNLNLYGAARKHVLHLNEQLNHLGIPLIK